ncbi:hypothetical protein ACFHWW_27285 [Ensifer sp. P24N7]|uniref:hypothetical protein n=1 Tax=Sinorhizobium sp. P24N7 TaxID=3348358 RepID=UPI0035F275DD
MRKIQQQISRKRAARLRRLIRGRWLFGRWVMLNRRSMIRQGHAAKVFRRIAKAGQRANCSTMKAVRWTGGF